VRLQPCGTANARFVKPDGKPLGKYQVSPEIVITPGPFYVATFSRKGILAGVFDSYANIDRQHYWHGPETDEQGRATLRDLIPGATFCFFTTKKWTQRDFVVESGKNLDLGDITLDFK
jgi:hypothetical protein